MKAYGLSFLVGLGLSLGTSALTPVEGILLGEAVTEIQTDPLTLVFTDIYQNTQDVEFKKVKNYQALLETGNFFAEQCSTLGPISYSTTWKEQQAKRAVVATLQYIGLDTTIRAIGAYAKHLEVDEAQFKTLTENIVGQYCSENVTVMSLRTIRKSLEHYYQNPDPHIIPNVAKSPYVTEAFKNGSETPETRSREFQYALNNFRAFCSWGGNSGDYRLLPAYLRNPFIMGLVTQNMSGTRMSWDEKEGKMLRKSDDAASARISCKDLVCRPSSAREFEKEFPRSTGSTGVGTDVNKLYCQHFRDLDYDAKNTIPEVKDWIKALDMETPLLETNFFISLMTGVPDPFMSQSKFSDIPAIVKSSVDERWSKWSKDSLTFFSKELLFEESLKVKAHPRRFITDIKDELKLDFHVTLGEMDRIMRGGDKIGMSFDFRLSKSWLKSLIVRWNAIAENLDAEGEKVFKEDIARYIDIQLRTKEKMFTQKLWNEDFSRIIAEELLAQVLSYRGGYFEGQKDEMLSVPVRFHYGIFALSYMNYRAQVKKGSTQLNL